MVEAIRMDESLGFVGTAEFKGAEDREAMDLKGMKSFFLWIYSHQVLQWRDQEISSEIRKISFGTWWEGVY